MGSGTVASMNMPYGVGDCKTTGHQYQWVDEGYNSSPGATGQPQSLRDVYGGQFVKHLFCGKCGDYRAVKLKTDKTLEKFLKMEQIKG